MTLELIRFKPAGLATALLLVTSIAAAGAASPVYPLHDSANGRYLVDARGRPFLLAGESPQAMMVNVSEADAELFFANRRSHGFNAAWINLICAKYTGGREDGSTIEGLRPFNTAMDFSTPNEAYFAHCDRILRLAAKYRTVVFLDPAETGSFLAVMRENGVEKCRSYGRYLGRRYAGFNNIVWMHGNDYGQNTPENDRLVTAIAEGIRKFDRRHLQTIELDAGNSMSTSLDDERWKPILGLSAAYTYGPVYVPVLKDYDRASGIPTFLVESGYEFEHLQPAALGTARQLRVQEYMCDLSGATGQLYGNRYTWPFLAGWKEKLDTPGAVQMAYLQALLEPRAWWKLIPDQAHTVVTAGYGDFGTFHYVTAAYTPDGRLVLAYLPDRRTITVDMAKLRGPVVARWYDPASGEFQAIGRFSNRGLRQFENPGDNADGPGNDDWVLVLETDPPRAQRPAALAMP